VRWCYLAEAYPRRTDDRCCARRPVWACRRFIRGLLRPRVHVPTSGRGGRACRRGWCDRCGGRPIRPDSRRTSSAVWGQVPVVQIGERSDGPNRSSRNARTTCDVMKRFKRPLYKCLAVKALRRYDRGRPICDEAASFNRAARAPSFSPTSVHERPNTRENPGLLETREQDESTR
jgi:hypothetical protein